MKIAQVQLDIKWHDKQANLAKAAKYIERAASDGCELVVLPEMFNSGYSMDTAVTLEQNAGETSRQLCDLAKRLQIAIVAGLCEFNTNNEAENIAIFIDSNGTIVSRYVKNYPFTLAGENQHYRTGNEQSVFKLGDYNASLFICYDLRFPELFRAVAKQVDVVFVIASWPQARQNHWEILLQARAIENQCYVVGVNRIGADGNKLNYTGGSHVFDPLGEDLSRGGEHDEYLVTQVDLKLSNETRKAFPFLNDMKSF